MNTDESVDKNLQAKCSKCYWQDICMLTTFMRPSCGGPFKDKAAHLKYIEDNIVNKDA